MTTIPVKFTTNHCTFGGGLTGNAVPHEFAFFAHVGNREVTELARVVRLTATGRIKRRAVECDRSISRRDDPTFERREVRVAKVEQFGQ